MLETNNGKIFCKHIKTLIRGHFGQFFPPFSKSKFFKKFFSFLSILGRYSAKLKKTDEHTPMKCGYSQSHRPTDRQV